MSSSPSSKNGSTAASAAATNGTATAPKYEARLCHVVKRPDFDGYGFNLHAEKGRPGQYIGKVDDGSPAESAGLRQGDRIIEVNGTNITNETHKKVVELIKAIPNETRLLVIDPRADSADLKAAIAASSSSSSSMGAKAKNGLDVNENSKQQLENPDAALPMSNGNKKSASKHDVNGGAGVATTEEMNNKKNTSNGATNSATMAADTGAKKGTAANSSVMTNGASEKTSPKTAATSGIDKIIEDTKALKVAESEAANGKATMTTQNGTKDSTKEQPPVGGPKLNLNMTAAELRAQLAARKKYDPKSEVTDLRKKYEIIQKM